VTNMIEAGLSEKEATEIRGHKTRAVFDRYHIVSERRMKQNAELEAHIKSKEPKQTVTDTKAGELKCFRFNGEPGGARTRHAILGCAA
jgi:ABC-type lipoprotein export system ATPase subunit